jgi:hypothetical protein
LGRQQSNCSKTGPQKIKPEEKKQSSTFPTGFSNVFFFTSFHIFVKKREAMQEKCLLKMRLEKM